MRDFCMISFYCFLRWNGLKSDLKHLLKHLFRGVGFALQSKLVLLTGKGFAESKIFSTMVLQIYHVTFCVSTLSFVLRSKF